MKRSNRKRQRPEEVVTKPRQADEAPAKGTPLAEAARSLGVFEGILHRWRVEYGAMNRAASLGMAFDHLPARRRVLFVDARLAGDGLGGCGVGSRFGEPRARRSCSAPTAPPCRCTPSASGTCRIVAASTAAIVCPARARARWTTSSSGRATHATRPSTWCWRASARTSACATR